MDTSNTPEKNQLIYETFQKGRRSKKNDPYQYYYHKKQLFKDLDISYDDLFRFFNLMTQQKRGMIEEGKGNFQWIVHPKDAPLS